VSKRFAVSFMALVSLAASAARAGDAVPADIETWLAPGLPLAASPASLPGLRLVWIDPTGAAIGVDGPSRAEAEGLLRAMGLRVSWRRGEKNEESRAGEVRVILLDRAAARDRWTPVLGATPPGSEGAPLVWVHVPGVRTAIGLPAGAPVAALPPSSVRALGLALGRVVAHETVHAVAPGVRHGAGLMSARLTSRQLTEATIRVELDVSLAVQAALRPAGRRSGRSARGRSPCRGRCFRGGLAMSTHFEGATGILRPVGAPRVLPHHPRPEATTARPWTPIERTLEALRGPFRPLIVWGLFWGSRPFSELMRRVPDVTKKTLRRELTEMERMGLVRRDVRAGSNRRAEYSLSPLGETLRPVVGAMYEWGLRCGQPRSSQDRMRARSGA
jgi:DNA-binding HxlR family transcriptional regulator